MAQEDGGSRHTCWEACVQGGGRGWTCVCRVGSAGQLWPGARQLHGDEDRGWRPGQGQPASARQGRTELHTLRSQGARPPGPGRGTWPDPATGGWTVSALDTSVSVHLHSVSLSPGHGSLTVISFFCPVSAEATWGYLPARLPASCTLSAQVPGLLTAFLPHIQVVPRSLPRDPQGLSDLGALPLCCQVAVTLPHHFTLAAILDYAPPGHPTPGAPLPLATAPHSRIHNSVPEAGVRHVLPTQLA